MDHIHSTCREEDVDVDFDLESGTGVIYSNKDPGLDAKKCILNPSNINAENNVNSTGKKMGKEKGKKGTNAKKPPRPPRGFSLDSYDQNLIKELAQLAIIKRARIERMKALKQKKASSSSSSSSSHAALFAMLFTIIFLLVILLQGRNSGVAFPGSPQMAQNSSIFTRDHVPYVE
ncbi:unnamed protein product [Lactuca saligna]|uniref:Transmembrane protein n=1 Tax=Lactuca saligna TaxID=75948 RepID=A0AA35ZA43_LACSI|nr:unnamed protein product [Lactuca saligna]